MMLFEQPPLLPYRPATPGLARPTTPGLARASSPTSAFTAFLLTSPLRPDEQILWQSILRALTDDDLSALRSTLELADQVMALHVLLACSHANIAPLQTYTFDHELLPEFAKLLGQQPAPLSALQLTCVLGAEDSALFLLEFTRAAAAAVMGSDKPVQVMMEQECGEGNTALHLASFNALPAVVKALLRLGANPNKRNGKGLRPVDCADESCIEAFWEIDEGGFFFFFFWRNVYNHVARLTGAAQPIQFEIFHCLSHHSRCALQVSRRYYLCLPERRRRRRQRHRSPG